MKTRIAAMLLVLSMLFAVLAGCGAAAEQSAVSASSSEDSAAPAAEEAAAEEPAEPEVSEEPVPETVATVQLTAPSGMELTLTHVSVDDFRAQDDGVIVNTRIGDTEHSSGSVFKAGSGLGLDTMRSTKQYEMSMVAFTYEASGNGDPADAIGEIGEEATLTLGGRDYAVQTAWITDTMGCFIFDCGEIPDTDAVFLVEDGKLRIAPPVDAVSGTAEDANQEGKPETDSEKITLAYEGDSATMSVKSMVIGDDGHLEVTLEGTGYGFNGVVPIVGGQIVIPFNADVIVNGTTFSWEGASIGDGELVFSYAATDLPEQIILYSSDENNGEKFTIDAPPSAAE